MEAKLSRPYWYKVVTYATYLQNYSPTKKIFNEKTPFELYHNQKWILLTFESLKVDILQSFQIFFVLNLTIKLMNVYCLIIAPIVKCISFKESLIEHLFF